MNKLATEKFRFDCNEIGCYTHSLRIATEWHKKGMAVEFYFNNEFAGNLSYAGHFENADSLPTGGDYGTVYSAGDNDALYISYPDDGFNCGQKTHCYEFVLVD